MTAMKASSKNVLEHKALVVLTVLAFLSPGAWLLVRLPPQPIAQALHLATVALWLTFIVWGVRVIQAPPRPLVVAVLAVMAVVSASLLLGRFPLQQFAYDLYADMPVVLWIAYPLMFLVAASVVYDSAVREAVRAVVFAGAVLVAVMFVWRWNVGFVTTFGSPAFFVPALAPLPFIALGLAATSRDHRRAYRALAAAVAAGLVFAGAGLSAVFMLGIGVLVTASVAPGLLALRGRTAHVTRTAASALLAVAAVVIALAQVPALGARAVGASDPSAFEQTVATRLYLWDAAGQMVLERPILGYGPAGYRFSAVEFYDPGVFPFIAAIGSDPIAYSAPSPHSLLWEVLTRLGVAGLVALVVLFVVWARTVAHTRDEDEDTRLLRLSLAIGFVAYLSALLVTPVHFASGLFGAVVAGFAVAALPGERDGLRLPGAASALVLLVAAAVLGYGAWRMAGLTAGAITGQDPIAIEAARVESAARIIPGEPLNERRRLEFVIWVAETPEELAAARRAVDDAPGYITEFLPNLPHFAFLGLNRGQQLGLEDFSWERELLERAAQGLPETPPLVAEQLHLAIAEGDLEALPALMERAERYGMTYPRTADYILGAREALVP